MSDRAKKFGVHQPAIFYALKRMNFPWKKKQLRYRERNREERLTGWLVSLMVDTVIIWDNKLNNNSIKKGMGFWIWEVAIANSLLSILWVDYLFIEKVLKIVKNMIKKGY